jgi:hypothetical protein
VLDDTRGADYAIWLVAFALYVLDSARLLAPREMLLIEAGRQRLAAAFSAHPLTLGGRVLAFGPLHLPHRGAFVAPWGRAWSDAPSVRAALKALDRRRRSLFVPRLLAAAAFLLLFAAGPALTLTRGPSAAILSVAALVYPLALAAAAALWCQRRALGLSGLRCALLGIELLVCPAFLPNLVRKITALHPLEVDGARALLATASPEEAAELLARLEARAEELLGESEPGAEQPLRAYLAALRSGR